MAPNQEQPATAEPRHDDVPWDPQHEAIFHPEGRFVAPDGRRFDYVFCDLIADPTLSREQFPPPLDLMHGGVRFIRRLVARIDERVIIGLRNTPGD
jgi:hypothetical protein